MCVGISRPLYLATGEIAFCDLTLAGQFRGTARDEIAERARQADSYLRLWRDYNDLERAGILERAQDFGALRYHRCEQRADGVWRFEIDDARVDGQALTERDRRPRRGRSDAQLEAGEEIPAAILGRRPGRRPRDRPQQALHRRAGTVGTGHRRIDLRPPREQEDRTPPKSGYLFVSLGGDETRIEPPVSRPGMPSAAVPTPCPSSAS